MSARSGAVVRVAAVAGACATLLAILALVPASGLSPQDGHAQAADCAWHRHAKRVVKHVHRHGKPRRVVRTRHWWTCDEAPPSAAVPVPVPTPVPPTPEPEPEANAVGVTARDKTPAEFGYTLSRSITATGRVRVELDNQGEDPHNLNLQRQGGVAEPTYQLGNALPGEQTVASFDLPPGTYRLWCSLLEHDSEGMHATLVVE